MKFLDFFAGIGGFRLGMEQAGHECVGHCEIDKYAQKSYKAMHQPKEGEWFAADIFGVEPGELPDADLYCGGFPCQSFSIAGKRGGFEDTRGTLFFEVMRLAKVRKPKYLFLENVKGLLSHDGGKTFGTILSTMGELGYDVEWQVLNSKDFGVPQNRERVFIVGYSGERSRGKVFPLGQDDGEVAELQGQQGVANSLTTGQTHTTGAYIGEPRANTLTARYEGAQATGTYVVECEQHAQEIKCIGNLMPSGDKNNSVPGRVYSDKGISPTLRTPTGGMTIPLITTQDKHGVMIQNPSLNDDGTVTAIDAHYYKGHGTRCNKMRALATDGYRIRRLTPKECFRLQGFPDWAYERAAEVVSNSQLYKQAGNSVTVNVIKAIGERMS